MPVRPRYPLDDSWLFADPMSLHLIEEDDPTPWPFAEFDPAGIGANAGPVATIAPSGLTAASPETASKKHETI